MTTLTDFTTANKELLDQEPGHCRLYAWLLSYNLTVDGSRGEIPFTTLEACGEVKWSYEEAFITRDGYLPSTQICVARIPKSGLVSLLKNIRTKWNITCPPPKLTPEADIHKSIVLVEVAGTITKSNGTFSLTDCELQLLDPPPAERTNDLKLRDFLFRLSAVIDEGVFRRRYADVPSPPPELNTADAEPPETDSNMAGIEYKDNGSDYSSDTSLYYSSESSSESSLVICGVRIKFNVPLNQQLLVRGDNGTSFWFNPEATLTVTYKDPELIASTATRNTKTLTAKFPESSTALKIMSRTGVITDDTSLVQSTKHIEGSELNIQLKFKRNYWLIENIYSP